MAAAAAGKALAVAGAGGRVDLLVVSTSSPEYHLPPMATQVQDRLGIERCSVLDIRSGCAGSVEALDVARLHLERGTHRTAVVIGSEVVSPLLVPIFQGRDPDSIRMRDRIPIYAFGDGAGAIVLQASEGGEPGFIGSASACVGGGRKPGDVGGRRHPRAISVQLARPRLVELKLDVVERRALPRPHVLSAALTDVLAACAMTAEQVDVCVVPEGNAGYLLEEMEQEGTAGERTGRRPGRIVENLADVGATGSAAVPWRSTKPGGRARCFRARSSCSSPSRPASGSTPRRC